jgi:hypothetical protein
MLEPQNPAEIQQIYAQERLSTLHQQAEIQRSLPRPSSLRHVLAGVLLHWAEKLEPEISFKPVMGPPVTVSRG